MFRFHKSMYIITFLLMFCVNVVPLIAQTDQATDQQYLEAFHEKFSKIEKPVPLSAYATVERYDELYMDINFDSISNNQGGIAWGWSYRMMSLNEMYQSTKNIDYLKTNLKVTRALLANRDDKIEKKLWTGKAAPAWGSDKYAQRGRAIFAVHTGMILYPMLDCLKLAKKYPELQDIVKSDYPDMEKELLQSLNYHDKQYRWGPGKNEGYYIGMDQEDAMENKPLPGNRLSAMGRALLYAWKLTGEEEYHKKALAIGHYVKNRFINSDDGAYYWPYWLSIDPVEKFISKKDINGEDISHASLTMMLLVELADEKDLVNADDITKLEKTVTQGFARLNNGVLFGNITGNPKSNPSLAQIPARWLILTPLAPKVYQRISEFYLKYVEKPGPLDLAMLIRYKN